MRCCARTCKILCYVIGGYITIIAIIVLILSARLLILGHIIWALMWVTEHWEL